jgi:alkylation response protein AidB-like acyl-CoA dehydrogenase
LTAPDYIARARALIPDLDGAASLGEARGRVDDAVMQSLHAAGFFRMLIPAALGGGEVTPSMFARTIETLARGDASPAWVLCQMAVCAMTAAYLQPTAAAEIFGPPGAALAWGSTRDGRAVAVPGGYRVSGTWEFGSGMHHATWLGGHCAVVGEDGAAPVVGPADRTVLFPKEAARCDETWRVLGLRGTGSDGYTICDHFVPDDHTVLSIARWPDALRRDLSLSYRFSISSLYAAGFGALALGNAQAMLDAFIVFAADKTPLWRRESIRNDPRVQLAVADIHFRLEAARAGLFASLAELEDAARLRGALTAGERLSLRGFATLAIRMATEASRTLFDLSGASILFDSAAAQRRFRDAQAVAQHLQGRVSHLEAVGRHLLGLGADLRFA